MKHLTATTALLFALGTSAAFAEAESCKSVRISNLGWTDILLTDATLEFMLDSMGYEAEQISLALGVTYAALKDGEIDLFQGNWRPIQDENFKEFFDNNYVERSGLNLEGAKYTLAVPSYLAEKGIKSFTDISANYEMFDGKIYGIEPGSNDALLDMIARGLYGFDSRWEMVETSESGMLGQVDRAISREQPVVFLAWEPHPMNVNFDITYLEGGDEVMGADYGRSTVYTLSRPGYGAECPNVAKLISQLKYTVDFENHGMNRILLDGAEPMDAAKAQLLDMPEFLDSWLDGVTTIDGQPALPVVKAALGLG